MARIGSTTGGPSSGPRTTAIHWAVVGITFLSFCMNLWGFRKNLPLFEEVDEKDNRVVPAVRMATQASLNPGWFGHPASTVIVPMAATYRILHGRNAESVYEVNPAGFYLIGRFLSVAYATLCAPLIYLLGRRVFGVAVGLIGGWFYAFYLSAVYHAQVVRSDSAATCFGLLGLWLMLRLLDSSSLRRQVLAGSAAGLAIASRYFLVALVPVLLVVDALVLRRTATPRRRALIPAALGLAAIAAAFAVSTPYLFLDWGNSIATVLPEARATHLGADGLSRPGHLWWYVSQALPLSLSWPQVIMALLGLVLVLLEGRVRQLLLVLYVAVFLAIISLPALHWERWLIPVLPIFAFFVAHGIVSLGRRLFASTQIQTGFIVVCAIALTLLPASQSVPYTLREAKKSTRILAREWIVDNLPAESRIVEEGYAAYLGGTAFEFTEKYTLADYGAPEDYAQEGHDYLIASEGIYGRYYREPERYAAEIAFYEALLGCDCLVQEFPSSLTQGGPTIRIYSLAELGSSGPSD